MVKKTYTKVLEDLKKEIRISGFESRYLGILFGLLGISMPIILTPRIIPEKSSFFLELTNISLFIYSPIILGSLILYYFSGNNILLKKASVIITALAGLFMILFVLTMSLNYKFNILTDNLPFSAYLFWIIYSIVGLLLYFRIKSLIDETFITQQKPL